MENVPCPVVTLNYQKDGGQDDYDRKRMVICVHGIVWGDSREDRPERRQLVSYFWVYTEITDEMATYSP